MTNLNSFKSLLIVLMISLCMTSCSKTSEQVKFIPKDANVVVTLDIKSIGIKSADFSEILSIENLKKMFSDEKKNDIKNAGFDLLSTAYIFGNSSDEKSEYWAAIVPLSDDAKFEEFVKGMDQGFNVASEGDFKIATSAKASDMGKVRIIAWNKDATIFLQQSASATVSPKDKVLSFFNLKKEESLAETDKNFGEFQKQSSDISLWVSIEQLANKVSAMSPMSSNVNMKETFFTASCNFEKGQILVDTKYHPNKETAELVALGKEGLNKDLVGALNGKTVIGLLGFAIDMDKLYSYLDKQKMLGGLEDGAKQTGMTPKELITSLSGDFAFTINGLQMKDVKGTDWEGNEITRKEPRPEFSLAIGVKDKAKIGKLLAMFTEQKMLVKENNIYTVQEEMAAGYALFDKGDYLIIAGPESVKQAMADGKTEKLNETLATTLTGNSSAIYLNFAAIPDEALAMTMGFGEQIKKSPIESFSITGSSLKDNVSTGKVVINFKDKEQNSLVTLAKLSNEMSKEKMVEATPEETVPADTVAVEDPMPEPVQ